MDLERTFIVSSTGSSGFRLNPADWVVGDLATVGMATEVLLETGSTTSVPPDSVELLLSWFPAQRKPNRARADTR